MFKGLVFNLHIKRTVGRDGNDRKRNRKVIFVEIREAERERECQVKCESWSWESKIMDHFEVTSRPFESEKEDHQQGSSISHKMFTWLWSQEEGEREPLRDRERNKNEKRDRFVRSKGGRDTSWWWSKWNVEKDVFRNPKTGDQLVLPLPPTPCYSCHGLCKVSCLGGT